MVKRRACGWKFPQLKLLARAMRPCALVVGHGGFVHVRIRYACCPTLGNVFEQENVQEGVSASRWYGVGHQLAAASSSQFIGKQPPRLDHLR